MTWSRGQWNGKESAIWYEEYPEHHSIVLHFNIEELKSHLELIDKPKDEMEKSS